MGAEKRGTLILPNLAGVSIDWVVLQDRSLGGLSTASGWGPQLVGDFNGTRKDDIANYHSSNGTWWVSRSNGSGFVTSQWADFSTATGWKLHLVSDFNGDNGNDIASYQPSNGTWWISRSTGSSFSTTLWADFSTASGRSAHLVGEFNGDGRHDIANFHPSNGTWWVSRSTGSHFGTSLWADFNTASGWRPQLIGDFNGDGRDDIGNYAPPTELGGSAGRVAIRFRRASGPITRPSRGIPHIWLEISTAGDDITNHHQSGTWMISCAKSSGGFATSTWFD